MSTIGNAICNEAPLFCNMFRARHLETSHLAVRNGCLCRRTICLFLSKFVGGLLVCCARLFDLVQDPSLTRGRKYLHDQLLQY